MKTDSRQLKAYQIARDLNGLAEIKGTKHNPEIVKFFAESGHAWVKDDETAWCAAFVGAVLRRAGLEGTGKLNARSYMNWGSEVPISEAREGDIVVSGAAVRMDGRDTSDFLYGKTGILFTF